jgi:hypothetical protein
MRVSRKLGATERVSQCERAASFELFHTDVDTLEFRRASEPCDKTRSVPVCVRVCVRECGAVR